MYVSNSNASGINSVSLQRPTTLNTTSNNASCGAVVATSDSLDISAEAQQLCSAGVPDSVASAVNELKLSQDNMARNFKIIGDYFAANGGRAAQDAFMQANFSAEQLRNFPPPADGLNQNPAPGPDNLPENVSAAVADLKGTQTSLGDDLKAVGDYFRNNGGREAHRAFMKANFSAEQREVFRAFHAANNTSKVS